MLKAAVLVTTEREFAEEKEVTLLLIHEEEVSEETLRMEAVFFRTTHFLPKSCIQLLVRLTENVVLDGSERNVLFIDELSFIIDSIELQLEWSILPVDGLFNVIIPSRIVHNSVLIQKIFSFLFFFHQRMNSEESKIGHREILGIRDTLFDSA